MIKFIYIVIVICITIFLLNWLRIDFNMAMAACQTKQNYETCVWNLQR